MNNLNSVLFEGTVVYEPVYSEKEVTIEVSSTRYLENGKPETIIVDVLISPKISISKDRKVRIVGRLAINEDGILIIVSEHVEVRKD